MKQIKEDKEKKYSRFSKSSIIIISLLVLFAVGKICWEYLTIIYEGQAGLVCGYGEGIETIESGLHFPFRNYVNIQDVREKGVIIPNFECSSKDGQSVQMNLNIIYKINPEFLGEVFISYGGNNDFVEWNLFEYDTVDRVKKKMSEYVALDFINNKNEIANRLKDFYNTETRRAVFFDEQFNHESLNKSMLKKNITPNSDDVAETGTKFLYGQERKVYRRTENDIIKMDFYMDNIIDVLDVTITDVEFGSVFMDEIENKQLGSVLDEMREKSFERIP